MIERKKEERTQCGWESPHNSVDLCHKVPTYQ